MHTFYAWGYWTLRPGHGPGAPGDFENAGFLGVPNSYIKAPADTKEKKLAAEIANGRLAMMAIIGSLG